MSLNNLNWSLEYYEEHIDECNSILNSLEDYNKIPLIDPVSLQTLTDGTLVRYRGMVQDMLNPEYYSSNYTVVNEKNNEAYIKAGKFRDIATCKEKNAGSIINLINEKLNLKETDFVPRERLVFYCISIPGTNDWVQNFEETHTVVKPNTSLSSGIKRSVSEVDAEMDTDCLKPTSETAAKKNKSPTTTVDNNSPNLVYDQNQYFPICNSNGIPCIIKVYEEEEKAGLILNDKVEVIGFLSLNPALEAASENQDMEDKALNPPPSLVPRIHAVQIKKLKHNNPLLREVISYENIVQLAENARNDLHLILTQLLFEDTLAADYMICHLLSRIYIRDDSNTIGKLSLNLFNIDLKSFAPSFYDILKTLVTNSHYVPLSTDLLNEKCFVPRKDYESNRLQSGILQLSEGVHLVLDETQMNEGQLNNRGCLNVAALQRLFRDQEVHYDFGYYPVKYQTDIPVLVISEGKSMFEADIKLKVKSDLCSKTYLDESIHAVQLYLNSEVLRKIRTYLTSARLLDFELGEEMMRKIGEDYVSLRQQDRQVSSSDLHTLLILSRLLAISRGHKVLRPEDWTQALEMETERKVRLK